MNRNYMPYGSNQYSYWIGLNESTEGNYLWGSGLNISSGNFYYNNWYLNPDHSRGGSQPNNNEGSDSSCAVMDWTPGKSTWKAVPCGGNHAYICQKKFLDPMKYLEDKFYQMKFTYAMNVLISSTLLKTRMIGGRHHSVYWFMNDDLKHIDRNFILGDSYANKFVDLSADEFNI